jgi:primosomal protein N' (replication factor Y)
MPAFVRVVLDQSAEKALDYSVPPLLMEEIRLGARVRVPVRGRSSLATVVGLLEESEIPGIKPVEALVEGSPTILPVLLEMAEWMAGYYCCPLEVALRAVLPQVVRDAEMSRKQRLAVELTRAVSEEEIEQLEAKAPRQAGLLRLLLETGSPVPQARLRTEGLGPASVQALEKRGLVRVLRLDVARDPHADETYLPAPRPEPNEEQKVILARLSELLDGEKREIRPLLLHGVTGSGKTEVYLRGIEEALQKGRTALVLVPEISLTPQTVERFKIRFATTGHEVAVLHSHLSAGERYDEWFKIHQERASIVIGARSAVFAPLRNLGLIVVDEEHENSYKQEEAPRYHARDLAVLRGRLEGCPVILGSATPSLESYHNAVSKKYELVELRERADDRSLPVIRILDMRVKKGKSGPDSILSAPLAKAMGERLARREQTILFLNRRGYSTSLVCGACGHVCQCRNCSVALTFHRSAARLVCHICGHVEMAPHHCPECDTPGIRHTGFGTEKLEEAVHTLLPTARIARMDADTMTRKNAYRETLGKFRTGQIDILVGTQMIAKGLHFPNVTLVGIVNADLGLHMPDFRAGERTFQLLTQVAGRAGRGEMEGEVLVQSFTPHAPAIQYARHHDFEGFWDQESDFRRQFRYPPFSRMVLIHLRGEKEELTKFTADTLVRRLAEGLPENTVLGEASPAPIEKAKAQFRYHIILRGPKGMILPRHVGAVLDRFTKPAGVYLAVDVDPFHLL